MKVLSFGTPVITFDTGRDSEIIDETYGSVVRKGDINATYEEIV